MQPFFHGSALSILQRSRGLIGASRDDTHMLPFRVLTVQHSAKPQAAYQFWSMFVHKMYLMTDIPELGDTRPCTSEAAPLPTSATGGATVGTMTPHTAGPAAWRGRARRLRRFADS